jgi:non-ribosomal peptide synthetase component F
MTADAKQRARVQQHAGGFEPLDKTFIEATIADRFESVVRKYPKRMAVVDRQSALTFEELHNQSNCLARIISQYCGNLPEPVAILFPQGMFLSTVPKDVSGWSRCFMR